MSKGFSEMTIAEVEARNARIGGRVKPLDEAGIYTASPEAPKTSKYRNVRTMIGGERFDSKREADYWLVLQARKELGEIHSVRRQVPFQLRAPVLGEDGMSVEVSNYVADFVYQDAKDGRKHLVDAKGHRTRMYLLKKKWLFLQDHLEIEEV